MTVAMVLGAQPGCEPAALDLGECLIDTDCSRGRCVDKTCVVPAPDAQSAVDSGSNAQDLGHGGHAGGADAGPTGGADAGPTGGADAGPTGGADAGPTGGADAGPTGGADAGPTGGADGGPPVGDAPLECTLEPFAPIACATTSASYACDALFDGDISAYLAPACEDFPAECRFDAECAEGCLEPLVMGVQFGAPVSLGRLRYRSDWWVKRPARWEVWASDSFDVAPGTGATLVASGDGRAAPWQCVTGEPCDFEVPDVCCPDGRGAPQRVPPEGVAAPEAKFDVFELSPGAVATVAWFVVSAYQSQAFFVLSEVSFGPACPSGEGVHQFVREPLSWSEARDAAANLRLSGAPGHLVAIGSADEERHVEALVVDDERAWIGLFQDPGAPDYQEPGGGWQWVTGEPLGFTRWMRGEPSDLEGARENVGELFGGQGWNDNIGDGGPTGYLVEYDLPGAPPRDPVSGHRYLAVDGEFQTWEAANAEAASLWFAGVRGHLVTITSAAEDAFVSAHVDVNLRWAGGYQDAGAPDYAEPAGGWRWVTGEAWEYTNWSRLEPNDRVGVENWLSFADAGAAWNDNLSPWDYIPSNRGCVVEFDTEFDTE